MSHFTPFYKSAHQSFRLTAAGTALVLLTGVILTLSSSVRAENNLFDQASDALNQGELSKAELLISDFIRVNPNDAEGYFLLGNILEAEGKKKDAESAYRFYIKNCPDPDPSILIQLRQRGFY